MVSFLRYFRTARLNAGVAKVLQDWAFAAPIPVKVDGRKINTLHACPTNREGSKKQVLVAVFLQSAEPKLSLPWKEEEWSPISRQIAVEDAHHIGCCVLLTVGSKYDASEMREFRWKSVLLGTERRRHPVGATSFPRGRAFMGDSSLRRADSAWWGDAGAKRVETGQRSRQTVRCAGTRPLRSRIRLADERDEIHGPSTRAASPTGSKTCTIPRPDRTNFCRLNWPRALDTLSLVVANWAANS